MAKIGENMEREYYNFIIDCKEADNETLDLLDKLCDKLDLDYHVEHD